MFCKFFATAFEGSMYGAGADVFAVWTYVLSHTMYSRVEINPEAVAPKIGMTVEAVEAALRYLEMPDKRSRSKEHDGRRMVKEGEFAYYIPNHRTYLDIKDNEDLRVYNARKQREHRAKGTPGAVSNGGASKRPIDMTPSEARVFQRAAAKEHKRRLKKIEHEGACLGAQQAIKEGLESVEDEAREELRRLTQGGEYPAADIPEGMQ